MKNTLFSLLIACFSLNCFAIDEAEKALKVIALDLIATIADFQAALRAERHGDFRAKEERYIEQFETAEKAYAKALGRRLEAKEYVAIVTKIRSGELKTYEETRSQPEYAHLEEKHRQALDEIFDRKETLRRAEEELETFRLTLNDDKAREILAAYLDSEWEKIAWSDETNFQETEALLKQTLANTRNPDAALAKQAAVDFLSISQVLAMKSLKTKPNLEKVRTELGLTTDSSAASSSSKISQIEERQKIEAKVKRLRLQTRLATYVFSGFTAICVMAGIGVIQSDPNFFANLSQKPDLSGDEVLPFYGTIGGAIGLFSSVILGRRAVKKEEAKLREPLASDEPEKLPSSVDRLGLMAPFQKTLAAATGMPEHETHHCSLDRVAQTLTQELKACSAVDFLDAAWKFIRCHGGS